MGFSGLLPLLSPPFFLPEDVCVQREGFINNIIATGEGLTGLYVLVQSLLVIKHNPCGLWPGTNIC